MITPNEIKEKSLRKYNEFLERTAYEIFAIPFENEEPFFPLQIKANKGKLSDDFSKREKEYSLLYNASKNKMGVGYKIIEENVSTKSGIQTKIKDILFETEKDFLNFISKEREFFRYKKNLQFVQENYFYKNEFSPEYLLKWRKTFIKYLISETSEIFWNDIFLCANWFKENPNSQFFIREIPLEVHTKFIEENKALIYSLFSEEKLTNFEKQLGLKTDESFVRFRALDENLFPQLNGICVNDIELEESDFENLQQSSWVQAIENIFIVENKMIYLTFPKVKNSICIWGEGFGKSRIAGLNWIKEKDVFYFGDLDEHGFEILSLYRNYNPSIRSFCMDAQTLNAFENFRVKGEKIKTPIANLNLTDEEKAVLTTLQKDETKNRLEQERISQKWILKKIFIILSLCGLD